MAEIEIVWTEKAHKSLLVILEFYFEQNGNTRYSEQLFDEIIAQTNILTKHPFIGKDTNYFQTRELVLDRNSVFYVPTQTAINILLVWDNRRNPKDSLKILSDSKT